MPETMDLKALERRVWTSYHDDGLLDVALGLILLSAFVGWSSSGFGRVVGAAFQVLVAPGVFFLGKRFLTVPRFGAVRFGPVRKQRRRLKVAVLVVAFLATLALWALTATGRATWLAHLDFVFPVGLGVVVFLVFSAMSLIGHVRRLSLIGLAFGGAIALTELLDTPIPFLIAGCLILIPGSVMLLRFLRTYAVPSESDASSTLAGR